ncbi:hypothetical protein NW762_008322 [Fusarium torreyae]|uniref:SGNH hydrolase-type esterase domain-containing protein n=1 Tax=Fusarium torreyae TaxID=1237075 RepID=A0A9W8RW39_9HYPO|nr:hypothetical protein NW762_008322 [Fusarium torreyae]
MSPWCNKLLLAGVAFAGLFGNVTALPALNFLDDEGLIESGHVFRDFGPAVTKRADKVPLRILPLGASIMSGVGSSNHNGLRKPLRDALRFDGWEVNMVGSLEAGPMKDNDHEAVSGDIIDQVHDRLKNSIGYKPNIVIINAGTNDASRNIDPDGAGDRMNSLLKDIWGASGMGDTCVMLSTILDTTHQTGKVTRIAINHRYRELVKKLSGEGKCIYLADMDPPTGGGAGWITWDDYDPAETTKTHPNDEGHRKMAYVFYKAINAAADDGKIKKPSGDFDSSEPTCDKSFGTGLAVGGKVQRGSGEHDGTFVHVREDMGVIFTVESDYDRNQWRFARLFDPLYDDFVGWFEINPGEHFYAVWKNSGDGKAEFTKIDDMHPNFYCILRGLHFIDMNADGLDDIVCIAPNGDLSLAINNGDGNRGAGKPPSFKNIGKIKNNEGYKQDRVRLADIDGDGRGDYGVIDDGGNVHFWRNGWVKDKTEYWQPLGKRFDAKGKGDIRGVRFEDINGDGRDDWLWLRYDGHTDVYTNTRSCKKGKSGDGLNVAWRQAKADWYSSGTVWTHFGWSDFMEEDGEEVRDRCHFARIYGERPVFGNHPKQDYVYLQHDKKGGKHRFRVRVEKNLGAGGSKVLADGNKYCNMVGHQNGMEDYVWTHSTSYMTLYINRGKKTIQDSDGGGFWDPSPGVIWKPPHNMHRKDLHLADWDDDGDCDIIYVNPETGKVEDVWINEYPARKKWEWTHKANPAPALKCNQKKGIRLDDLAVRFADLTGNGRADYLCLEKDGRVTGFVHKNDGGWEDVGQIKYAEGKDRANLRWADVNGDGRDDMIWVDKFNGDGSVWYNENRSKPSETSGSSFRWRKVDKPVYQGSQAGTCMFFPDLDGNGRADMLGVQGTWTNIAYAWLNPSCALTDHEGDDDGGVVDPKLPIQPGGGEGGNDENDWRSINCSNPAITNHILYQPQRWRDIDTEGAWLTVLEGWQHNLTIGQEMKDFSNNASFLSDMFCESFVEDGNHCKDAGVGCQDVNYPAGYFIIMSLSNLYTSTSNMYKAITAAVDNNDIGDIAKSFGEVPKEKGITTAMILDFALMGWGIVMGPAWNKAIGPKFSQSSDAGTVKDTTNDLVKNSIALTKDVIASRAKTALGIQNGLQSQMQALADAWKESAVQFNSWVFGGSVEGNLQLGNLISDGSVLGEGWLVNRDEYERDVKRAINSFLIPLAWSMSPDGVYPFIATADVACDESPGWNKGDFFNQYNYAVKDSALEGAKHCYDGKPYWLFGGRDVSKQCDSKSGDSWCGEFDVAPGIKDLRKGTFSGISLENVIAGSVKTKKANGGKNGGYRPNIESPSKDTLQTFLDNSIESPGVWSIPICPLEEVLENYYRVYSNSIKVGSNFPCNA